MRVFFSDQSDIASEAIGRSHHNDAMGIPIYPPEDLSKTTRAQRAEQNESCPFFDKLLPEIRNMIYKLVTSANEVIKITDDWQYKRTADGMRIEGAPTSRPLMPGICKVSRQTHAESIAIHRGITTWITIGEKGCIVGQWSGGRKLTLLRRRRALDICGYLRSLCIRDGLKCRWLACIDFDDKTCAFIKRGRSTQRCFEIWQNFAVTRGPTGFRQVQLGAHGGEMKVGKLVEIVENFDKLTTAWWEPVPAAEPKV